jgi:hypothetical protein
VAGSCEHGNEPSASIKCGEFLDWLSVLLASQEGLCSMELVSWYVKHVDFVICFQNQSIYIFLKKSIKNEEYKCTS